MRLFLDCEWNGHGGELISMALVSEHGMEWYEVLGCKDPTPWVAENVMPVVGGRAAISRVELAHSLSTFLCQFTTVHIVADWPEDIAYFCKALIVHPGERVRTPPLTMAIARIDSTSGLPHNALADAIGIRTAVLDTERETTER